MKSGKILSKYQRNALCTSSLYKSCTVNMETFDSFKTGIFFPPCCREIRYRRDSFRGLRRAEPEDGCHYILTF